MALTCANNIIAEVKSMMLPKNTKGHEMKTELSGFKKLNNFKQGVSTLYSLPGQKYVIAYKSQIQWSGLE